MAREKHIDEMQVHHKTQLFEVARSMGCFTHTDQELRGLARVATYHRAWIDALEWARTSFKSNEGGEIHGD